MQATKRLPHLDFLRAVAILWVILHHLADRFVLCDANPIFLTIIKSGNAGVDLFFVLSGYLIGRITLSEVKNTGGLRVRSFWYRRWMRTLPAYFATLILIVASDYLIPSNRPWHSFSSYLVFLQNYTNDPETMRFVWSWSLCVEEWFYLSLPLLVFVILWLRIRVSSEVLLRIIAVSAIACSNIFRYALFLHHQQTGEIGHWNGFGMTHLRLDSLGTGLFVCTLPRPRPNNWIIFPFIGLALIALGWIVFGEHTPVFAYTKFATFAVIFGTLVYCGLTENTIARINVSSIRIIADLSYSLYLVHPVFTKAIPRLLPSVPVGFQLIGFAFATLLASLVMRYGIERPFLFLRDKANSEARTKKQATSEPSGEVAKPAKAN